MNQEAPAFFYIEATAVRPNTSTKVCTWFCIPSTLPNGQLVGIDSLRYTIDYIIADLIREYPGWHLVCALKEEKDYLEYSSFELDFA